MYVLVQLIDSRLLRTAVHTYIYSVVSYNSSSTNCPKHAAKRWSAAPWHQTKTSPGYCCPAHCKSRSLSCLDFLLLLKCCEQDCCDKFSLSFFFFGGPCLERLSNGFPMQKRGVRGRLSSSLCTAPCVHLRSSFMARRGLSCIIPRGVVCASLYVLVFLSLEVVGFRAAPWIARENTQSTRARHVCVGLPAGRGGEEQRGKAQEAANGVDPAAPCSRKDVLQSVSPDARPTAREYGRSAARGIV